jgi:beta-glucosidase
VITLPIQVETEKVRKLNIQDEELYKMEIKPSGHIPVKIDESVRRIVIDEPQKLINTHSSSYTEEKKPLTDNRKEKLVIDDIVKGNCSVEEFVAQLSVEELAQVCVGHYTAENASVIGNASSAVPGAAGDTTYILNESRGMKNLIMADGPAGLRLQPIFKTYKNGELVPGGELMGDSYTPFPNDLDEKDVVTYYQYCTAIPIGWALAQSWNMDILQEIGDMVGTEMEQFGVDLWLAPALNIHRNPLCGRNFEYYSEDPLISGKSAAAITKGVQKHHGKGTTIKHFAANNQEDNRFFTNAHISERALREIYLKGFEIAVKESQPFSIMTSYNLINGIHSANHYDMLQGIVRDEWGFEGMFMTDWCTSQDVSGFSVVSEPKYPISASTGCIYSGNDLQMPGCKKNVDDIIEAIEENKEYDGYKITLGELQYCAVKIIKILVKTL